MAWLRRFFARVARGGLVPAWEPRGAWPRELVARLCAELDLVHVVDPLRAEALSRGRRYFRLHGVGGYRHRHTDADLGAVADRLAPDDPNSVLFNNRCMAEDARRFLALVRARALPRA